METIEVGVTGMTCGHCVAAVTEEVAAIPEVEAVAVDLQSGGVSTLRITASGPVAAEAIGAAVAEAGYQVAP